MEKIKKEKEEIKLKCDKMKEEYEKIIQEKDNENENLKKKMMN